MVAGRVEAKMAESIVHATPALRERGDTTLPIHLGHGHPPASGRFEVLWCRKLADSRYELCCVPFFVYSLALGDVIEVEARDGEQGGYDITRVIERSGHATLRAWFGRVQEP